MKKILCLILCILLVCVTTLGCEKQPDLKEPSLYEYSETVPELSDDFEQSETSAEISEEISYSEISIEISEETSEEISITEEELNTLSSKTVFVYDPINAKFIYEKNTETNIIPASITKLLTALYALEVAPIDLEITPRDELYLLNPYSSVAGINGQQTFSLEQLIAAMLVPSGNDAAYTVAAGVARYTENNDSLSGREALDIFMSNLNEYARTIGCTGTVFTVPDGLAGNEHYTTAHDLAIIGEYAINNPIISKYTSMDVCTLTTVSGHYFSWKNTNQLLHANSKYHTAGVTGLKTGTLDLYSLMVSVNINESTYIIGIFDAPTHDARYVDATTVISILSQKQTN